MLRNKTHEDLGNMAEGYLFSRTDATEYTVLVYEKLPVTTLLLTALECYENKFR